jgi:hypothetical protein
MLFRRSHPRASLTGFEFVDTRLTCENTGETREVDHGATTPKHPDSPRSVHALGPCETDHKRSLRSPRATLVAALGDAVRAGIEGGDSVLVRVAARALAELVAPGDGPVIDLATERAKRGV